MWISKIVLNNVRSFQNMTINLSKNINLLVGPNNSGKSTIVYAALSIQQPQLGAYDVRAGSNEGKLVIDFEDTDKKYFGEQEISKMSLAYLRSGAQTPSAVLRSGQHSNWIQIPANEPINFIYPYLSKRKVSGYGEGGVNP